MKDTTLLYTYQYVLQFVLKWYVKGSVMIRECEWYYSYHICHHHAWYRV